MTSSQHILAVIGTRPEAIKMAPVVRMLRREPGRWRVTLCSTAQHREILDQALRLLDLSPDIDLDLMRSNQSLNEIAARSLSAMDRVLSEQAPDWLLVQGDTTTAMCAALAAFHRRVRIAHIEAGLRTGDLRAPFPEELNRRVVDLTATDYFAPTDRAAAALRKEGVAEGRIYVTGNTVVDALLDVAARQGPIQEENVVLITAHRRENFGEPLRRIVRAVVRLAGSFPETHFVHVGHPNPNVMAALALASDRSNLTIQAPLDYGGLVHLLRRCRLVLTDSGGLQEEAPTFGKPVLILRDNTERPEGVEAGIARVVGTDEDRIVQEATRLLSNESERRAAASHGNPYGDGHAAERIVSVLAGRPFVPFAPVP
jgi:UDP-N-acetylglucosamine 2-epimerase (non-hydrolysing)